MRLDETAQMAHPTHPRATFDWPARARGAKRRRVIKIHAPAHYLCIDATFYQIASHVRPQRAGSRLAQDEAAT